MYLETLQQSAREKTVRALIIGAGEYGFSLVARSQRTPGLSVTAIHARRTERAPHFLTSDGGCGIRGNGQERKGSPEWKYVFDRTGMTFDWNRRSEMTKRSRVADLRRYIREDRLRR